MKTIWIAALCCVVALTAQSQPWMPANPTGPVKFQDVVNGYRATHPHEGRAHSATDEQDNEEEADYRFDKWEWYWKQHLDENGYMVAPVKTYTEWQNYLSTHPTGANKTTSTASNWIFQGPNKSPGGYSGIGRINTVAFHPTDPNTFFIGSAGGGEIGSFEDEGAYEVGVPVGCGNGGRCCRPLKTVRICGCCWVNDCPCDEDCASDDDCTHGCCNCDDGPRFSYDETVSR